MEKKISKIGDCSYEIELSTNGEEWKEYIEKAYVAFENKVEVPGFRKGKAPKDIARSRISTGDVMDEAVNRFVNKYFQIIVEEEKFALAEQPHMHLHKISMEEVSVEIHLTVEPIVNLGQYKDLKIERQLVFVLDEEVEEKIKDLQSKNAELVVKENASVASGDVVIIDFEGFVDGVAFEGGKASRYQLEVGSNSFIPGFEDQLVGHSAGEDFEIKVTFPHEYAASLADKDATFKIHLHEVKQKVLPEINDELALDANLDKVENLEQLKEFYRGEIRSQKEKEASDAALDRVIDKIIKDSTIEISSSLIEREKDSRLERLKNDLSQKNIDFASYLTDSNLSEEDLMNKLREQSKNNIVFAYVIMEIAAKENINVTDEEIDETIKGIASMYGQKVEVIKEALKDRLGSMKQEVLFNKVYSFLKKVNIVE